MKTQRDDGFVICPYNQNHCVLRERMRIHMITCESNPNHIFTSTNQPQ